MIEKLVLATHNKGKVKEFEVFLKGLVGEVICAGDLNLPEPEETETTFTGNAVLKAVAAMKATGLPALADDSGLSVDGLNGDPGIYSARWAGPEKDFGKAMGLIDEKLSGAQNHRAAFIAVLALAYPDGTVETFEGAAEGFLCWPPRGERGFGYDPMFVPDGHTQTFAQIAPEVKHAISHRAKAVEKLTRYLNSQQSQAA